MMSGCIDVPACLLYATCLPYERFTTQGLLPCALNFTRSIYSDIEAIFRTKVSHAIRLEFHQPIRIKQIEAF
jgi:hypothetical protein